MSEPSAFFDTNILLYLLSDEDRRADIANGLLAADGVGSQPAAPAAAMRLGLPPPLKPVGLHPFDSRRRADLEQPRA